MPKGICVLNFPGDSYACNSGITLEGWERPRWVAGSPALLSPRPTFWDRLALSRAYVEPAYACYTEPVENDPREQQYPPFTEEGTGLRERK